MAVDHARRVYVADRTNNRIQVFTEDGRFVERWPDITDPAGVYIDESESGWVVSAALNRILKCIRDGVLQYHWGGYGGTRGGFVGGLSRPHQIDGDQEGIVYSPAGTAAGSLCMIPARAQLRIVWRMLSMSRSLSGLWPRKIAGISANP